MHELQVALAIVDQVREEMTARKLPTIKEIGVRIGALSGVDPDALSVSFQAAVADTDLEPTHLKITYLPVKVRCRSCMIEYMASQQTFRCPSCSSGDIEIIQGEELIIEYLAVE